jgi:hypothetical protein
MAWYLIKHTDNITSPALRSPVEPQLQVFQLIFHLSYACYVLRQSHLPVHYIVFERSAPLGYHLQCSLQYSFTDYWSNHHLVRNFM